MAIIGTFTAQSDGFGGTIRTLTLNANVKFVPNTKTVDNAPTTALWQATSRSEQHGSRCRREIDGTSLLASTIPRFPPPSTQAW